MEQTIAKIKRNWIFTAIILVLLLTYFVFRYRTRVHCTYEIYDYQLSNPTLVVYNSISDSKRIMFSNIPSYEIHLDSQINFVLAPLELGFADFKFYRRGSNGSWVELSALEIRDSINCTIQISNGIGMTTFQYGVVSSNESWIFTKKVDSLARSMYKN